MRSLGRVLSVVGIFGFLFLLSLSNSTIRAVVNESPRMLGVSNVIGALTAVGIFVPWLMAFYDWGTRFRGKPESKRRWGLALVLTMFVGAGAIG